MMFRSGGQNKRSAIPLGWMTLLMTAIALPLATYFAVNATAFSAELETRVNETLPPGIVTFDRFEIDPDTHTLHIYDLLLRGIDGLPMVRAAHAELELNWSDLSLSPPVSLVIPRIRITGYEVRCSWNEEGTFNFTEGFGFKSKGLVRPVAKPKPLLIFDGIELVDGIVRIQFPDWGFEAHQVFAQGRVEISKEGLFIQADLNSTGGYAWSKELTKVADTLANLAHPAPKVQDAASIPLDSLHIGGFVWDKQAFRAAKVEVGLPNITLSGSPSMDFAPPMVFRYLISLITSPPMTAVLSNGLVEGNLKVQGLFEKSGNSSRFLLEYFDADRVVMDALTVDKLHYSTFSQQQEDVLDLVLEMQAQSIQVPGLRLTDLSMTTTAKAQWSHFEIGHITELLRKPPLEAISDLMARRDAQIDIGMTQLDLGTVAANDWWVSNLSLRGARATYGDGGTLHVHLSGGAERLFVDPIQLGAPTLDLRVSVPYPNVELSRLGIAWEGGTAELSGHLKPEIGLLSRKAPYELVSEFTELPVPILPDPFETPQDPPQWAQVSGSLIVTGDLLKKQSMTLRSSALSVRTPDGVVRPLVANTDPKTSPELYLGPLPWVIGTGE